MPQEGGSEGGAESLARPLHQSGRWGVGPRSVTCGQGGVGGLRRRAVPPRARLRAHFRPCAPTQPGSDLKEETLAGPFSYHYIS